MHEFSSKLDATKERISELGELNDRALRRYLDWSVEK